MKFKVGDIVEWDEREVSINKKGLEHVQGKIIYDNGILTIQVREWEPDGTELGIPGVGYLLTEERIKAIEKYKK